MEPNGESWLEEGTRVLISSNPIVEQLHEYSHLPWSPGFHSEWQGKVGYISRLLPDGDSAWVKFFEWNSSRIPPANGKRLIEIDVLFHSRAFRPITKLHFLDGDRPVLVRTSKGKRQFMVASLRSINNDDDQLIYTLKVQKSAQLDWTPQRFPNDILLPIYVGRGRQFILRERNHVSSAVDTSSVRLVYGHLQGPLGSEIIHSLRTWSNHDGDLFRLAIQRFPEQVNEKVNGKTPLMVAVEEGIWPAIVILIAFSGSREFVDEHNNTLLHLAAAKGDVHVLEGLLGFIERDINKVNAQGDTVLHLATRGMHAACVDRLLCVPNIHSNITNKLGDTVLHVICSIPESSSSLAILSRILGNPRINPNMVNGNGWTPLHISIMRGSAKYVELMIMSRPNLLHSNIPPPLVFAAMHGKNKVVDVILMLKQGFAVEQQTLPDGKTAIHVAVEAWQGDVKSDVARLACVQSLVTSGVPVTAMDSSGQTACHLLVRYMNVNPKTLERVILANTIGCQKATMMLDEMAAKLRPHWQLACLCFLTARGCDLTAVDNNGQSAIDLCIDEKLKDTLQLMVQNRLKCCLPMAVPTNEFDTSDVHMCTFNCDDSVADVQFIPCMHRVMCKQCASMAPLRRCPMCYSNIISAVDLNGKPVEMGSFLKEREQKKQKLMDKEKMEKITEEVVKKVKQEAEIEKRKEIDALKEALEKLEMETSCAICLDARPSVVFNCGHTSCSECSEAITVCHICRQPIQRKMILYT